MYCAIKVNAVYNKQSAFHCKQINWSNNLPSFTLAECFSPKAKHLQGMVGVQGLLVSKFPSLFSDAHLNVTCDDKSTEVLYTQCVAKPSTSQEHIPLWQSVYLP